MWDDKVEGNKERRVDNKEEGKKGIGEVVKRGSSKEIATNTYSGWRNKAKENKVKLQS